MDCQRITTLLYQHLKKQSTNHKHDILEQPSLKDAHIYCVIHDLSSQVYGSLLEYYIQKRYDFAKNKASDCNGDLRKNDMNVEIKVSLGGKKHSKFNYVQIRPSHNISYYILSAYHLTESNLHDKGHLYIYKIDKESMIDVLTKYGTYAHGTKKQYGNIDINTIYNHEYAIRMSYGDKCWLYLKKYLITEEYIYG